MAVPAQEMVPVADPTPAEAHSGGDPAQEIAPVAAPSRSRRDPVGPNHYRPELAPAVRHWCRTRFRQDARSLRSESR